ncbi:MAG: DUF4252 domain-containing protein [Blastocatellia bacterium]
MKLSIKNQDRGIDRAFACLALLLVLLPGMALAQGPSKARIQIDFDKLADKASEVVEVNVDQRTLKMAAKFLKDNDPEEAAVKSLINGLQGIYVRVYQFEKAGEYDTADIEPVRSQLRAPGWSRLVGFISKREGMKVEVHTMYEGEQMLGLTILAAEPKELVVVNIVGPVDLEKLSQLDGRLGLPKLELKSITSRKSDKK